MAIIPEQFMNAVVAIGNNQFDANGNRSWIGSGFIVCRKERQNSRLLTYYVLIRSAVTLLKTIVFVSMITWELRCSLLIQMQEQILLQFNLYLMT